MILGETASAMERKEGGRKRTRWSGGTKAGHPFYMEGNKVEGALDHLGGGMCKWCLTMRGKEEKCWGGSFIVPIGGPTKGGKARRAFMTREKVVRGD